VEMRDEPGEFEESGNRSGGVDQDETTAVAVQVLVQLEHDAEPARVDEGHSGEVDEQIAGLRRLEECVAEQSRGVGIDLAGERETVRFRAPTRNGASSVVICATLAMTGGE
jgi:hypothetical protein